MSWYYAIGEQREGPVTAARLRQLVSYGNVKDDTLVWTEGMADWRPLREVRDRLFMDAPEPVPVAAPAAGDAYPQVATAFCPTCGAKVAPEALARVGETEVCPNCKDAWVRRIREGAPTNTAGWRYAGFWIRFGAVFLDGIIMTVVNMVIGFGLGFVLALGEAFDGNSFSPAMELFFNLIGVVTYILYYTLTTGSSLQGTLGKRIVGIRVIKEDGSDLGYGLAAGRYVVFTLLNIFTLTINCIVAGFDEEKRALHDRVCSTRVIYRDSVVT